MIYGRSVAIFTNEMQRPLVFPHRSVRSLRLTTRRLLLTIAGASALSLITFALGSELLRLHEMLCSAALRSAGIPAAGESLLKVIPSFDRVQAPEVAVPGLPPQAAAVIVPGALVLGILFLLHRAFPIARSFLFFLMALIAVAYLVMATNPGFTIGSSVFTLLWLRTQVVLWCLLPWLSSFLILPVDPSPVRAVGWILLIGVYGVVWSAVRLAFCLGVMHYTGLLFSTALWFTLGPLSDLLYVLVFYSLAVRQASKQLWGVRQCQF